MQREARWQAMAAIMAGFFVMGFCDIIGTVMNQVKAECALSDLEAGFLPSMTFVWFFAASLPAGIIAGRIGRKRTVLVSLVVTAAAMLAAIVAGPKARWGYFASFALLGLGNTIMQAALPALMSNVVPAGRMASRISLGQFVKAMCAAATPLVVYFAAARLGNWKLVFPLYGALAVAVALWLNGVAIPAERREGPPTSFRSCLATLKNPYVAAMTVGILFSVGADVGFAVAIPEFLKGVYAVDLDLAGAGPTVYFVAKTLAALFGAALFARVSAAKCLPWCMALGLAATLAMLAAPTPFAFLALVFVAALATANSFGMCMALALERAPQRANEIPALMTMAIVGGAMVTPLIGFMQGARGAQGIVAVLALCLVYMLGLGVYAARSAR